MVSDPALKVAGGLFVIMEEAGQALGRLRQLLVALFGKPKGGFRPIGFFQDYIRLFARYLAKRAR
eukprot:2626633-Lingulodinium_polyedra.AAC.1